MAKGGTAAAGQDSWPASHNGSQIWSAEEDGSEHSATNPRTPVSALRFLNAEMFFLCPFSLTRCNAALLGIEHPQKGCIRYESCTCVPQHDCVVAMISNVSLQAKQIVSSRVHMLRFEGAQHRGDAQSAHRWQV